MTATIGTVDASAKSGFGAEKARGLPFRIDAELDEGLTIGISVGTSNQRSPVTDSLRGSTPFTALATNTRRVDVEVGCSVGPVGEPRDS